MTFNFEDRYKVVILSILCQRGTERLYGDRKHYESVRDKFY